jgi:L-seryl-tRNA(Ser) seleniumtransferase
VGGGSLPLATLESRCVIVEVEAAPELARRLRAGPPPVVGRLVEQGVCLDLRCIEELEIPELTQCVIAAARGL